MAARRSVPAPACPNGHAGAGPCSRGQAVEARSDTSVPLPLRGDDERGVHYFTVLTQPKADARLLIDQVVSAPACPRPGHGGRYVWPNGTYKTAAGERQRYRCVSRKDDTDVHTFSAELPRAVVEDDTCCSDCEVLTPRHAGTEAASRRLNVPTPVIVSVLRELADGHAYTAVSKRALEQMKRPTGRVRTVGGKTPDELHEARKYGPRREPTRSPTCRARAPVSSTGTSGSCAPTRANSS
ncbi:MAG: hypothetical protein JWP46_3715 [Modestobacter sp.]|nr:hypothetical protein [Modestobacter sp.]